VALTSAALTCLGEVSPEVLQLPGEVFGRGVALLRVLREAPLNGQPTRTGSFGASFVTGSGSSRDDRRHRLGGRVANEWALSRQHS